MMLSEAQILIENWGRDPNRITPHSNLGRRPPTPDPVMPSLSEGGIRPPNSQSIRSPLDLKPLQFTHTPLELVFELIRNRSCFHHVLRLWTRSIPFVEPLSPPFEKEDNRNRTGSSRARAGNKSFGGRVLQAS